MIPVSGYLIKLSLSHKRSLCKEISSSLLFVLYPSLESLNNARTLWKKYGESLSDRIYRCKILKLSSELIVVSLLCLLKHSEVLLESILLRESNSVYTLKHLIILVALPISTRALSKLERFYRSGSKKMRSRTKVCVFALLIEADNGIIGKLFDKLYLIRLILLLHKLNCFFSGKLESFYFKIFLYYLLHFALDIFEVLGSESSITIKIIIESALYCGPDSKLCLRIKAFYCLRENMRGGMSEDVLTFLVLKRKEAYLTILGKLSRHIRDHAVYLCGDKFSRYRTYACYGIINAEP